MNITGNTIFISGATSGIGLGLALRFQQAGNKVIVGGRRTELLDQISSENPELGTVVIDTTDPQSITAAYEQVTREHPDLNVLITMAGIMLPEDLHTPDFLTTAERTVTTNLLGPIRLVAAFIPFLAQQEQSTIVTVSSGLAFVPLPATPTYSATKAAIHSFTDSMRAQLSDTSIQVIELAPPAVRTTLMGMQDSDQAMPLDAFLNETMTLLETQPDAEQILVENVKFFRYAEANGSYRDVLGMLSNS
ncbi:SDR family oxidoreductase [Microbacterium sp. PMB16]|uniref:SDR family oxidoreductase n=1 Tax=Microbacterium sp. PMB16 TaxID=3120157 RepID=UPI003F4C5EFC